ncbi:MAG: FAD-dependent oxidoreductase [Alphaproteobacteria bacterium]
MEEEFPKVDIYPPQCHAQSVIGCNVGMRPYRSGGIRLELEKINDDQSVYHNYGHGGAGASLAPGCAKYIVELFSKTEGGLQRSSRNRIRLCWPIYSSVLKRKGL